MELTLGRLFVAFRILPARQRSAGWLRRREGPAGETDLARGIRLWRDKAHIAGLEPRMLRDVGLEPTNAEDDFDACRVRLAVWTALYR
ncbi:hypothetical protein [Paracraurococcus lichenis]|uniref:DUF1127 domain-containing protein n=1 Tax=Paracraurococcus lichenis TaxID=3064888 RepID=A0ABT9EAJ7_9PROT|nr:hypothetical protein [Paracraurococcus sp. LOR1-02]MDO9713227.1 hypothetical protein [Paracraurococcus sp. LOR1-02]